MKSLKVLSIIGLVLFSLSLICLIAFDNDADYLSAIGWGMYAALYGIALAIVALVKVRKYNKTK